MQKMQTIKLEISVAKHYPFLFMITANPYHTLCTRMHQFECHLTKYQDSVPSVYCLTKASLFKLWREILFTEWIVAFITYKFFHDFTEPQLYYRSNIVLSWNRLRHSAILGWNQAVVVLNKDFPPTWAHESIRRVLLVLCKSPHLQKCKKPNKQVTNLLQMGK